VNKDYPKERKSTRQAVEDAIARSKERCPFCASPLPYVGRCPCPKPKWGCDGDEVRRP